MGLNTNNNTVTTFDDKTKKNWRDTRCYKCRIEFKQNDEIFHKRGNKTKNYHKNCWEKMLIS